MTGFFSRFSGIRTGFQHAISLGRRGWNGGEKAEFFCHWSKIKKS
jgi:hypothetical protein